MAPLTPLGQIIATILIGLIAGIIGRTMGTRGRITEKECDKNRNGCSKLLDSRLKRIEEDIKKIFELIDRRMTGGNFSGHARKMGDPQ